MKKLKTECSGLEWGDFLMLVDQLKKSKDYQILLFASLGTYCGLRASDILKLRWTDILHKTKLEVKEKKTGKIRCISMNSNLNDVITLCYEKFEARSFPLIRSEDYVFANRRGTSISIQYINRKLHLVFNKLRIKVQNPSTHTFRKTFGKRCYEANGKSPDSLVLLSQIFGHSSIAITRKYIGISQEQIQNVYLSL